MIQIRSIVVASAMLCACAGTTLAQDVMVAGTGGAIAGLADKPAFRPVTQAIGLAARGFAGLALNGVNAQPLLDEDAQHYANGDRTLRVGIELPVAADQRAGQWIDDTRGGRVWVMDLTSFGAAGLRVHFTGMHLPDGAQLSVQSVADLSEVSGPFGGDGDLASGEVWSEPTVGQTARIEYHVPAATLEAIKAQGGDINKIELPFAVSSVIHRYVDPDLNDQRGEVETCHTDINCVAAWNNGKYGVARIDYVKSGGNFICTGELLNTTSGDLTPYFILANHCFNTQASATSAVITWQWWLNGCNGTRPDFATRPKSRVATHLSSGATSDYTFIMVEGELPNAKWFQGWSSAVYSSGTGAGVHCPGGGVMRYSSGSANTSRVCSSSDHFRTNYNTAPTEPGSSGSGWYDSSLLFRGQLHCGYSYCNALNDGDDWGSFSTTYPNISGFLSGGTDDGLENNDSCAAARAVSGNSAGVAYNNLILKSTDADWYSITVPAGSRLIVTFNFEDDYGDIDAQLLDGCSGAVLAGSASTSDVETLDWSNYGAGRTVQIHPYLFQGSTYADTRNGYSMNVKLMDAPPQNDLCANARVISSVPYSNIEDNSNAANDGAPGSCNSSGATSMDNSIWYKWTAPVNITATLTVTTLTSYDSLVVIWRGASCGSLTEIGCVDPNPSVFSFDAVAGQTYWFEIGDWGVTDGGGSTQIQLSTSFNNDDCSGARVISSVPFTTTQDTSLAQAGGGPGNCNSGSAIEMQNDIWFRWTPSESCFATLTLTELTSYDMTVQVWSGACGSLSPVVCGDEPEPIVVNFTATAGVTYFFQIGDWGVGAGGGNTQIQLTCRALNDDCSGAELLPCNSYIVADTTKGTDNPADPFFTCRFGGAGPGFNSLWYKFVATSTSVRLATGTISPAADDSLLALYAGSCAGLSQIACDDDSGPGLLSAINAGGLVVGATYYVQVAAWSVSDIGVYFLTIECPPNCSACPSGSVAEAEACSADSNGGCNADPVVTQPITCNTDICGTATYDGETRDTDWFEFTLTVASNISWCVTGTFDIQAALLDVTCPFPNLLENAYGNSCTATCVTASLAPGTYRLFVAPQFGNPEFPCGDVSRWTGRFSVTPYCQGDLNGDLTINTLDLTLLLQKFGQAVPACSNVDIDGNGAVNTLDLTKLLQKWGQNCVGVPTLRSEPVAPGLVSPVRYTDRSEDLVIQAEPTKAE